MTAAKGPNGVATAPMAPPLAVAAVVTIDQRIANARRDLAARLAELERRVGVAKHRLDPRTWIENPWARVGLAAGLGFILGRSRAMRPVPRAAVGAAVSAAVRQALARLPTS